MVRMGSRVRFPRRASKTPATRGVRRSSTLACGGTKAPLPSGRATRRRAGGPQGVRVPGRGVEGVHPVRRGHVVGRLLLRRRRSVRTGVALQVLPAGATALAPARRSREAHGTAAALARGAPRVGGAGRAAPVAQGLRVDHRWAASAKSAEERARAATASPSTTTTPRAKCEGSSAPTATTAWGSSGTTSVGCTRPSGPRSTEAGRCRPPVTTRYDRRPATPTGARQLWLTRGRRQRTMTP